MKSRMAFVVVAALLLSCLAFAPRAEAQGYYNPPPPGGPPPGVVRSGLIFGFGVGLGAIFQANCDECDSLFGGGLQGHIGGMISPTLALMFDANGLSGVLEDDSIITHATYLLSARGWLSNNFWLQGGLGLGVIAASDRYGYDEGSRGGFAGSVAAGIDVFQNPWFTIDLQARLSITRFSARDGYEPFELGNFGVFVGFNWY